MEDISSSFSGIWVDDKSGVNLILNLLSFTTFGTTTSISPWGSLFGLTVLTVPLMSVGMHWNRNQVELCDLKTRLFWYTEKCSHFFHYFFPSMFSLLFFRNPHFTGWNSGIYPLCLNFDIFHAGKVLRLSYRSLTLSSATSALFLSPTHWCFQMRSSIFLIFKNESSPLTTPLHNVHVNATASQILLKTQTRMEIVFPLFPESSLCMLEESVHFIHFDPSFLWCCPPNILRSCECCYSFTNKGSSWLRSARGTSFLCNFMWAPSPTSCFLG